MRDVMGMVALARARTGDRDWAAAATAAGYQLVIQRASGGQRRDMTLVMAQYSADRLDRHRRQVGNSRAQVRERRLCRSAATCGKRMREKCIAQGTFHACVRTTSAARQRDSDDEPDLHQDGGPGA